MRIPVRLGSPGLRPAALGVALLALLGAPSAPAADGETFCRWRERSLLASKDACVTNDRPFENYGDINTLCAGRDANGIWRGFISFPDPLVEPGGKAVQADLTLVLDSALGPAFTNVQACRASSSWEELQVTWNNQPGTVQPCPVLPVTQMQQSVYNWDVTEYACGVAEGQWLNHGFKLQAIVESTENLRRFIGRQGLFVALRPRLNILDEPPAEDISAAFTLDGPDRITLALQTGGQLPAPVSSIELYFQEQDPIWTGAQALSLPPGWSAELGSAECLRDGASVSSNRIRFFSTGNPLRPNQELELGLQFSSSQPSIPTERVELQLVATGPAGYQGKLAATEAVENPPPNFEIAVNAATYQLGDPLTLRVDLENPTGATLLTDPYIVLQSTGGELYSYVYPDQFVPIDPANFVATLRPVVSNFPIPPGTSFMDVPLFTLTLGAAIPIPHSGGASFFAALAAAGTLDLLTPIDSASFNVQ